MCKATEDGCSEGMDTMAVSLLKDTDMSKEAVIENIEVSYALSNEKVGGKVKRRETGAFLVYVCLA